MAPPSASSVAAKVSFQYSSIINYFFSGLRFCYTQWGADPSFPQFPFSYTTVCKWISFAFGRLRTTRSQWKEAARLQQRFYSWNLFSTISAPVYFSLRLCVVCFIPRYFSLCAIVLFFRMFSEYNYVVLKKGLDFLEIPYSNDCLIGSI